MRSNEDAGLSQAINKGCVFKKLLPASAFQIAREHNAAAVVANEGNGAQVIRVGELSGRMVKK